MAKDNARISAVFGGAFNMHGSDIALTAFGGDYQVLPPAPADEPNIFGGIYNCMNVGQYNTILGGARNTLTGNHNAILGGCGNNDAGFNCVGIFGCNVTAVTDCAFHANNYTIQHMPASCIGAATNQLYYNVVASGCAVFIC